MLSYEAILTAVAEDAALSRRRRLQPVGGQGDKIFPPTYPGEGNNAPPRHVFERRRVPDEGGRTREVWCVLIDSVQSQANRLEEARRADRSARLATATASLADAGDRAEVSRVVANAMSRGLERRFETAELFANAFAEATGLPASDAAAERRLGRSGRTAKPVPEPDASPKGGRFGWFGRKRG